MAKPLPDSILLPSEVFREAVAYLGGQSATARLLDVSQQAISAKLARAKPCSPEWVLKLASATRFTEHDFRPDLYRASAMTALPASAPLDSKIAR